MGLFIGKIQNSEPFTLDNATLELDRDNGYDSKTKLSPIYGVIFKSDGTSNKGIRLYDAKGLKAVPAIHGVGVSELSNAWEYTSEPTQYFIRDAIDDFRDKPPFNIDIVNLGNEGILDSDTNFVTHSYNMGWVPTSECNCYIRIPKFYYCRPQKWEFLVSPNYLPGFLPSTIHYRNGHMYNYAFISARRLDYNYNYYHGPESVWPTHWYQGADGTASMVPLDNINIKQGAYYKYDFTSSNKTLYNTNPFAKIYNSRFSNTSRTINYSVIPLDYASLCMLYFLFYIKYATMDIGKMVNTSKINLTSRNFTSYPSTINYFSGYVKENQLHPANPEYGLYKNSDDTKAIDAIIPPQRPSYQADAVIDSDTTQLISLFGCFDLIGGALLVPGIYVRNNQLFVYDMDKYYNSSIFLDKSPELDPNHLAVQNENWRADGFDNYQILLNTDNEQPFLEGEVKNIGYNKKLPWAIYPIAEDSKTNSSDFWNGSLHHWLSSDLINNTSIYLCQNGQLPNLTAQTIGSSKITHPYMLGYFVQD